jgi:hypothetical protein
VPRLEFGPAPQLMESLTGSSRDYVLRKVGFIAAARVQGYSEDEVADKAGYRGAGHMRQQLVQWGFPPWFVEGDSPPEPKSQESAPPEKQARGSGEITDLPPAANAMSIFRGAIEKLSVFVERLPTRKEQRQGNRFVVSYAKPLWEPPEPGEEDGYLEAPPDAEPDEDGDVSFMGDQIYRRVAGGASRIPDDGLTAAIAAAILTGATTDELIDVLQDAPAQGDRKKARELVEGKDGLKKRAGQLAALMRGYPVGQGHRTNEVSKEWQSAAWDVQRRRGYGYTEKEIARWLNEQDTFLPELKKSRKVTVKDVRDLLSLDLEPFAGFKDQLNRKL